MNLRLLIFLLAISALAGSCKKHSSNDGPVNNVCDISQSQLTEVKLTVFKQGESPRIVVSTNQYTNGVLTGIVVQDSSTVVNNYYNVYNYPAANRMTEIVTFAGANLYDTTETWFDNWGNVDSTYKRNGLTKFNYNSSHQLTAFIRRQAPAYPASDSVCYNWQNGNVAGVDYYANNSGMGTMLHTSHRVCEYYPGYPGKQFYAPALIEQYNLCFCPNEVLPLNFIKSIKYYDDANSFLGQEFFEPVFDAGNKLSSLKDYVVKDGDTISAKNFSFNYHCK